MEYQKGGKNKCTVSVSHIINADIQKNDISMLAKHLHWYYMLYYT